jgi:hypothetical protein
MPGLPVGPPAARSGGGPGGGTGPLRNGNPRGDPNLAPRCGARARSGNPCRAPGMANGRCRMHGGKCTGPRTPEGKARTIAAHTTHGQSTAAKRAVQRYVSTLAARMRLLGAALRLRAHLPAELKAPDHPTQVAFSRNADPMPCNLRNRGGATGRAAASGRAGGAARLALRVREVERLAALAEANGQAPWRQAIAFARAAKRAARQARGQVLAARRTERARAAGGAARISRSDAMQREDRRGGSGLGNGGARQGAEGATPRIKGPGARLFRPTLTRRALVCDSRGPSPRRRRGALCTPRVPMP